MPYENIEIEDWSKITKNLVDNHPLKDKLVDACLKSWASILNSKINSYLNREIKEMELSPQSMAVLLHDIIPIFIEKNHARFRKGITKSEKDVVCKDEDSFSFEIKTSSSSSDIFANRSYAQPGASGKGKSGFYLAINFEKFSEQETPDITMVRFGWIDFSDWNPQKSQRGQQASLSKDAKKYKLITLYKK